LILNCFKQIFLQNRHFYQILYKIKEFEGKWQNLTSENSRLIDHTPESVDRYIKDGTLIEKLYSAGYNEWDMAFFTGLPIYVVQEYVEIIKSYEKEKSNKTDIENQ
jgi:hypothetical protein